MACNFLVLSSDVIVTIYQEILPVFLGKKLHI